MCVKCIAQFRKQKKLDIASFFFFLSKHFLDSVKTHFPHMYRNVLYLAMVALIVCVNILLFISNSWRLRGARLPPLWSVVGFSVTPCGFRGSRIAVWVGFSLDFSRFPLPQISFYHFSTLISLIYLFFLSSSSLMVRQA